MKSILSVLCALSLAACSAGTNSSVPSAPATLNPPDNSTVNIPDGNTLDVPEVFDMEMRGSVVEFSDDFCVITPTEGDDNIAYESVLGYEDPEKNITVYYQEGCVIQIMEIDVISGERNFIDATIADIKKQTSLVVYGISAGEHELNATTVYIARYQQ